jgi:FkbM family methyltransferase
MAVCVARLVFAKPGTSQSYCLRVKLPSGRTRRFYVTDFTQVEALFEVFVDGGYAVDLPSPASKIVDLGANAGQAAAFFRDRFPSADILSVEADPDIAALAERNAQISGATTIIHAAVCDRDGTIEFTRLRGFSWASNLQAAWAGDGGERLSVPAVSLEGLFAQHGIDHVDLLKVDIEGAELTALTSDNGLARVGQVVGELHPALLGVPMDVALEQLRSHGGFTRAKANAVGIFVLQR